MLYAKGDTLNKKKVNKISKNRHKQDNVLYTLYSSLIKNGGKANEFLSKKEISNSEK